MTGPRTIALAGACWMFALPAAATILNCRTAGQDGYTVILSEPDATPAAFKDAPEMRRAMNALQFVLDQGRDGQWLQPSNGAVNFVFCEGQRPVLDGREFDKTLVETLYNQSVLIEMWGSVDAEVAGGVRSRASAQINFLLVPVRFAANQRETALGGLLRLTYPEAGAPPTGDFVELLARPQDLDGFVAAALGYKALREGSFDLALGNLCRSAGLIARVEARLTGGRAKVEAAALRQFVVEAAGRALAAAKGDHRFQHGPLMLLDAADPCRGSAAGGGP